MAWIQDLQILVHLVLKLYDKDVYKYMYMMLFEM